MAKKASFSNITRASLKSIYWLLFRICVLPPATANTKVNFHVKSTFWIKFLDVQCLWLLFFHQKMLICKQKNGTFQQGLCCHSEFAAGKFVVSADLSFAAYRLRQFCQYTEKDSVKPFDALQLLQTNSQTFFFQLNSTVLEHEILHILRK